MDIYGVMHSSENIRNAVINHIEKNHPNLESIMLESHPDAKKFQSGNEFMMAIENHFSDARIIHGDLLVHLVEQPNMSYEELINYQKAHPIRSRITGSINSLTSIFDGRMGRIRNKSIHEIFLKEKPDVTVLGAAHASYLRKRVPEANYYHFGPKEIVSRLMGIPFSRGAKESHHIKMGFDLDNKRKYRSSMLLYFASLSLLGHSVLTGGPPLHTGTYLGFTTISAKDAFYWFRSLGEK